MDNDWRLGKRKRIQRERTIKNNLYRLYFISELLQVLNMKNIKNFDEFICEKMTSDDVVDILKQHFLNEGIEVSLNRRVFVTDKHEKLVDTSITNNPTVIKTLVPNVEVYSVFQRKEGDVGDGNPLLYALKKEKGYILTNASKTKNRIEYIVGEFFKRHGKKDVTIMVPSTNDLNDYFAKVVARHCVNPKHVDDILVKMSIEEVDDCVYNENSAFRKHYGKKFNYFYSYFKKCCKKMGGVKFKFHGIDDMEMRSVIEHTIKLQDDYWGNYIDAFNGKDVVIVDDSITFGNTILESCKIITECYTPKSITVLTLLSPLYCEDGTKLSSL